MHRTLVNCVLVYLYRYKMIGNYYCPYLICSFTLPTLAKLPYPPVLLDKFLSLRFFYKEFSKLGLFSKLFPPGAVFYVPAMHGANADGVFDRDEPRGMSPLQLATKDCMSPLQRCMEALVWPATSVLQSCKRRLQHLQLLRP